jgi:hypothetical protein
MKGKQHPVKAGARSKPPADHSGNMGTSDFWLINLFSREVLGVLQEIADNIDEPENRTVDNAVRLIVESALVHWDEAEPLLCADQKYSNVEGFASLQHFHAQTIAAKFTPEARALLR